MSLVRLSLNEVEVTVRKAGVGCGLPVGYAEDLGTATAWLCRHGLDGLRAAVADLEDWRAGRTVRATARREDGGWRLAGSGATPLAAWFAAPACADLGRLCEAGQAVTLAPVAHPLLVLGSLGCAATLPGPGFRVTWSGGGAALGAQVSGVESGDLEAVSGDAAVALTATPAAAAPQAAFPGSPPAEGIAVDTGLFKRLDALARLTLVPETATSRARGAGAGLRDTD